VDQKAVLKQEENVPFETNAKVNEEAKDA